MFFGLDEMNSKQCQLLLSLFFSGSCFAASPHVDDVVWTAATFICDFVSLALETLTEWTNYEVITGSTVILVHYIVNKSV